MATREAAAAHGRADGLLHGAVAEGNGAADRTLWGAIVTRGVGTCLRPRGQGKDGAGGTPRTHSRRETVWVGADSRQNTHTKRENEGGGDSYVPSSLPSGGRR